ncbi:MAG: hypothetical protein K0B81_02845 [Candidatus Cloacimonetes bacterium]|nr:hypothetical protein [Candidatus Cloacimonadota bacterium]
MNSKWKDIILFCSLLFNVILAGFILYHVIARPLPRQITPRIPINREHLREKHREINLRRTEFFEYKQRFMEALAAPDFNESEMSILLDELLEKQNEMEHAICTNLIEIRKNMNAEQAERFFREFPHQKIHNEFHRPKRR